MQRYLQEDTLNSLNIHHFDKWISNFGQPTSEVELKAEGGGYRTVTRISKYYNLPELMSIFNEVADIQTKEMLNLPTPKLTTGNSQIIACEPSEELLYFMDDELMNLKQQLIKINLEIDNETNAMRKIQ